MEIDKILLDWSSGYQINESVKGRIIRHLLWRIQELENHSSLASSGKADEVTSSALSSNKLNTNQIKC